MPTMVGTLDVHAPSADQSNSRVEADHGITSPQRVGTWPVKESSDSVDGQVVRPMDAKQSNEVLCCAQPDARRGGESQPASSSRDSKPNQAKHATVPSAAHHVLAWVSMEEVELVSTVTVKRVWQRYVMRGQEPVRGMLSGPFFVLFESFLCGLECRPAPATCMSLSRLSGLPRQRRPPLSFLP